MAVKISYIIPVYNGKKSIRGTLNSIYAIGLDEIDFEIIIVDDCSTDNTMSVLNEYAELHSNIRILQQPTNQKQGMARNRAIPLASGEYITFVDADDLVERGMREALDVAIKTGVDLVMCQTQGRNALGEYTKHHLCEENDILNGREFLNRHYHWHLPGAPWGYLFKRTFLQANDIRFIQERFHEDADWILKQIYFAETIKVCKSLIYTYVENTNSTVHQTNSMRVADSIHADYRVLRFGAEHRIDATQFSQACIKDRTYSIDNKLTRLWKLDDGKYYAFYKRLTDDARTYLAEHIDQSACRKITLLHLQHKYISLCMLYLFARPIYLLRKIVRKP